MDLQSAMEKFNVKIASIFSEENWVKTVAREIDLGNERSLGLEFDKIAQHLIKSYNFAGISSNNIYWRLTLEPVRIVTIPAIHDASAKKKRYITILNPKMLELDGVAYESIEACGSIPDNSSYVVKRQPYVLIGGYDLKGEYIELEYGDKNYSVGEEAVFAFYFPQAWIIQHEIDHLNGVTINDKGALFDSGSLMPNDIFNDTGLGADPAVK